MPVNFYVEYLESQRFGSSGYQKALSETLRRVVWRKAIRPGGCCGVSSASVRRRLSRSNFSGGPNHIRGCCCQQASRRHSVAWRDGRYDECGCSGSLDLALRLHPDTQNVAVIAGDSEFDRYWLGVTRDEIRQRHGQLEADRNADGVDKTVARTGVRTSPAHHRFLSSHTPGVVTAGDRDL